MEKCLRLVDVERVAIRDEVSPGAIYYWFNQKLKPALGDILVNETPGPKPQSSPMDEVPEPIPEERLCEKMATASLGRPVPGAGSRSRALTAEASKDAHQHLF